MTSISAQASRLAPQLIELRHRLHQIPEPGLDLPQTGAAIRQQIEAVGLDYISCDTATGYMAVLRGTAQGRDKDRPIVLLRADMDGLPITEESGEDFASTNGAMHACGHDLHMAGLVGAMRILAERAETLAGDVVFMFQPGEEGHDGAQHMIDQGMLAAAGRTPDHAYGLHVFSARYPAGFVGTRPGAMMASSDTLQITVRGRGGHGSAPHEALDPVPVAAEIVTQTQVAVSREFNIFDPVVATCGHVRAGSAPNVIPETAHMEFTLRAFSPAARERLKCRLVELAEGIASAHGMRAECNLIPLYPVTMNNSDEVDYAANVVGQQLPGRWATQAEPMAAAEDFAKVLQLIPGCFVAVSAVCPGQDHTSLPFNHSTKAQFADAAVPDCAAILASLAAGRLNPITG